MHYAAITQGNAALYLKFFVEKCQVNVFVKNRQGLTAREYAQKVDRFKYHRVVRLLRDMEKRALDSLKLKEAQDEKLRMKTNE